MNDDQKKTKVGWYVRNEKLDRLAEIKRIKNNQLEMSGSPELKDVEIVEMALDDLYYKVMSKSKDKDTNERLSNMIDNKVSVSYENIEMMNVNIPVFKPKASFPRSSFAHCAASCAIFAASSCVNVLPVVPATAESRRRSSTIRCNSASESLPPDKLRHSFA